MPLAALTYGLCDSAGNFSILQAGADVSGSLPVDTDVVATINFTTDVSTGDVPSIVFYVDGDPVGSMAASVMTTALHDAYVAAYPDTPVPAVGEQVMYLSPDNNSTLWVSVANGIVDIVAVTNNGQGIRINGFEISAPT